MEHNGQEVTLHNARRIWFWDEAATLSQLATDGVLKPDECKFTVRVNSTNIESSPDEMKVLDNMLFRCWLDKYDGSIIEITLF